MLGFHFIVFWTVLELAESPGYCGLCVELFCDDRRAQAKNRGLHVSLFMAAAQKIMTDISEFPTNS